MRLLLGLALLFALAGIATANPSPFARRPAANVDDGAIYLGPAGVMLAQDYFGVARPPAGANTGRRAKGARKVRAAHGGDGGKTPTAQSCD